MRKSAAGPSKPEKPPAGRKRPSHADWEAVHRDYRTGQFTLRELAKKHGVSHQAVDQHVKKGGWTQDLREQIKQATDAKLHAEVAKRVDAEVDGTCQATAEVVLAAAEANTQVILGHRSDLNDGRQLAKDLLEELRLSRLLAEQRELLAQILADSGAEIAEIDDLKAAIGKALGLGNRVSTFKAWTEAVTKLHAGERIAFGLDEKPEDGDKTRNPVAAAVADFLSGIHGNRAGRLQHAEARKA